MGRSLGRGTAPGPGAPEFSSQHSRLADAPNTRALFAPTFRVAPDHSQDQAAQGPEDAERFFTWLRSVYPDLLYTVDDIVVEGQKAVARVHAHGTPRGPRLDHYFRERALEPSVVEDETIEYGPGEIPGIQSWVSFKSGTIQMQLNAFHDMIAAISAYISLLEHDLVLASAFSGFDPAKDDLTDVIGLRWGDKFDRLLGKEGDAARYRQRLTDVVERWRNLYSHGGFEKGHGATIYLHTPGVGAVPVGLTSVRSSPLFSFIPAASETDITQVFELFGEIDTWLTTQLPEAMQWIDSGLDVPFDESFRTVLAQARQEDDFEGLLQYHEYQQAMIDNMDY